jgi:hypothetical protein
MFGRVREEFSELAARFDARLLDPGSSGTVLDDVVAIENIAATLKAELLAHAAERGVWREHGARSAAEEFARRTGVRVRDAHAAIETGRRLRDLPATAEAARRGELSIPQTTAIADAASVDLHAEARLLEQAESGSLQELRDACAKTKANVTDLEARRRRIHESLEAHAADALHELICGDDQPARAKASPKILVRVDLDALMRGYPLDEETCEIAGYGPVAVSAVREMIDTGDPFLAAIATRGEQVLGVAHLGRRANAKQQSALEWLYPVCAVEGCTRSTFLENDTVRTGRVRS